MAGGLSIKKAESYYSRITGLCINDKITLLWFFIYQAQLLNKEHLIPTPVSTRIQGLA